MPDVFISYSSEDRVWVNKLAKALENYNLDIWWDPEIKPGQPYRKIIQTALDEAQCVIVVWSKASINSIWVQEESSQAITRGVLIPITYENVRVPMPFNSLQTANLSNWLGDSFDDNFQKLISGIEVHCPNIKKLKNETKSANKTDAIASKNKIKEIINKINRSKEIGSYLQIVVDPSRDEAQFLSDGKLELTKSEKKLEIDIVAKFPHYYTNDTCAAVINKPHWADDPLIIRFYEISYGGILARRKNKKYTAIVSSNVLLLCEEQECLLLHRRSSTQYDYANALHTFGGAFIPPGSGPREDISGIKRTALREIMEESEIGVFIPKSTPQIIIDENEIQFIQTAFIGVNVTSEQLKDGKGNWEGDPVFLHFNKIYDRMLNLSSWTPTGWVHVLCWLALDTPGTSKPLLFDGISAPELADIIAEKCLSSKT